MPEFSPDYCPDCGGELEVRSIEARERLWCSDCENVEWLNPKICAGIIVTRDNEILLQKRGIWPRKGTWSIPGGFLELEESTLEAAKRETFEETGLKVVGEPEFLDHVKIENPDGSRVVMAVYTIDHSSTEGSLSPEEDEVEELKFWSFEEVFSNKDEIEQEAYLDLIKEIKK